MTFSAFEVKVQDSTISYYVSPARPGQRRSPLVVVHGRSRSTMRLAKAFAEGAYQEGFSLLVPVFDTENYHDYQILRGLAGPCAAAHALNAACADAALRFGFTPEPIALIGFSAGAQFAHRYAMRFPERVTSLVVAAAGWYTMPRPRIAFPYGCAPSIDMPEGIQELGAFFRIPTRVMVGDSDVDRDNKLRTSPALDEDQGVHRLERARRWVDAVCLSAVESGVIPQIHLEILPESGHSAKEAIHNGGLVKRSITFLASQQSAGKSTRTVSIHE